MVMRRLFYLAALTALGVFYIYYQEWVSWMALMAILGLPWLSLVLSLPAMLDAHLELEAPARLRAGTPARMELQGVSRWPLPPVKSKILLTRPITGESWILKPGQPLPTDHCGALVAQFRKPRMTDYLGLFRIRPHCGTGAIVTVLPEPVPPETMPDLQRYLARSWRPKSGGGFSENHELRLYRPGDGLNQVHWKLSAKTGKLIIREPMIPERGLVLLTMDVEGTADILDRKFGRLLWLGEYLLKRSVAFEIRAMTQRGLESLPVADPAQLEKAMETLLAAGPTRDTIRSHPMAASWQLHIGGQTDET